MRLIDAVALDNAFTELRFNADGSLVHWGDRKDWCLHGSEIEKLIADAPTVDAVPVVRCKDCKWYNPKGDDPYFLFDFWCDNDDGMWNPCPESYCSFGERREE